METITFVVLAKSYKPGGRCIAGKLATLQGNNTLQIGAWVRPVPNDGTGHSSLSEEMYRYEDGSEVRVLDVVEVGKVSTTAVPGQPENFVFDESKPWRKLTTLRADSITNILDPVESLWHEQGVDTNIVTALYDQSGGIIQSLCLIKPSSFVVTLSQDYNEYEGKYKKKIVAGFDYQGVRYDGLSVTCPSTRRIFTNQYPDEGGEAVTLPLRKGDDYALCISLSPRFGGAQHHYKLVATVFDFDGYLQGTYQA